MFCAAERKPMQGRREKGALALCQQQGSDSAESAGDARSARAVRYGPIRRRRARGSRHAGASLNLGLAPAGAAGHALTNGGVRMLLELEHRAAPAA
jgi:hypothetical protein